MEQEIKTINNFPLLALEEEKCIKCGKTFIDNYKFKNELNKRIYCKDCIDLLFKELIIKK